MGQQLSELILRERHVALVKTLVHGELGVVHRVIVVVPVRVGVVDPELDALRSTGISKHLDDVLFVGRGVHNVEVGVLRVPHGEAVVVLRGDDDVVHAGSLREAGVGARVELHGVESFRDLHVLTAGDLRVTLDLFPEVGDLLALPHALEHRVDAPVNE